MLLYVLIAGPRIGRMRQKWYKLVLHYYHDCTAELKFHTSDVWSLSKARYIAIMVANSSLGGGDREKESPVAVAVFSE